MALGLGMGRSSVASDHEKPGRAAGAESRAVSFLNEVRPSWRSTVFSVTGPTRRCQGQAAARSEGQRLRRARKQTRDRTGKPEGSLAWERITTDDKNERMPPEGKAEPLTAKQIATLKTWIEQGAKWEDHWSFVPPEETGYYPQVSDKAWVRDPLDAFVLARLEREHLKPEAEATREAWLRRASFDLTGLPPTPEELDEFLTDKRPDAYETQTDRLLKSKRFGERQAQEWLDLARYADTSGYQNDSSRADLEMARVGDQRLQREHAV